MALPGEPHEQRWSPLLLECDKELLGLLDRAAQVVLAVENQQRCPDLADVAQKALQQVRRAVAVLTARRLPADRAQALADALTSGQWTHDYPIAVAEARELGFTVSTEMPRVIYDLMQLYPQSGRRRPSVEYVPLPYRAPATPLPGKREPR